MYVFTILMIYLITRVAKQMSRGVKREFPTPNRCVLTLPGGFPYEAFDGKAQIKAWHVLHMIEGCRSMCFPAGEDGSSYLDFQNVYSQNFAFIVSARLDVRPQMYSVTTPKAPLRIEKELLYHGTSSVNIRSSVFSHEPVDCLLAECQQTTVAVSKDTRRPTPLPEWWKTKYANFSDMEYDLRIKPSSRPGQSEISSHPMVVQACDTDTYFHVNWAAFLKFCLDAVAGATWQRDKLVTISDLYRPVKSAELAYVRECNLGDHLNVEFWSDESSKDKLNFEILNFEKKVVLHSTVEYFDKNIKQKEL